jgi:hypothetical protein
LSRVSVSPWLIPSALHATRGRQLTRAPCVVKSPCPKLS